MVNVFPGGPRGRGMDLDDAVVVITGASSGIGRAAALMMGAAGATVVNADLTREPRDDARPTDTVITDQGGTARYVETDVTRLDAVRRLVELVVDEYSGLDVMVNNAGRAESYAITGTTPENWRQAIDINLTGVYHGSLAAVEAMREHDGGVLVNVASVFGVVGGPNSASYSAAKGGVIALTRQIARDYAREGIRANSVSPGFIETPMLREDTHEGTREFAERTTPMSRVGTPDEVAGVVVFLASGQSAFITGQNIVVDGGYAMA